MVSGMSYFDFKLIRKHKDRRVFLAATHVRSGKIKIFTNEELHTKCIPYLFFTTATTKKIVMDAYSLSVQGFFTKPNSMSALKNTIRKILEYWQESIAPGQFDM